MGKRRPARVDPPDLPDTLVGAHPDHTVDLHGFTGPVAVGRVNDLLTTWVRKQPGAVLHIVTGKGNRSTAGPVLLHAVEDYLREELAAGPGRRISDLTLARGGGGWMVRVAG